MADEQKKAETIEPGGPRIFIYKASASPSVASVTRKQDVGEGANEVEAAFSTYQDTFGTGTAQQVQPPFDFDVVADLVNKNTLLPPLIDAMEVNVDGTGAEIVEVEPDDTRPREAQSEIDNRRALLAEFFDEPYPGESFLTQRRALRRDVEGIGNAYLEEFRNAEDELIFVRPVPGRTVRLIRLDEALPVKKKVTRGGQEVEVELRVRERRYVQAVGRKLVWFKEHGASRDLDRESGKWAAPNERLPFKKRANAIIHLTCKPDPFSPYGLPRWWSNAPSVVGSRRAEEFNLNFFDSGGIPPLLIIVSGGELAAKAEQALREHFMSTGETRHQAAVIEAYSTAGDIDSPANVKVTVERFGSERQKDSMFENYLAQCDGRVKRAFRMPSIFLGLSQDFNFATAFASMVVAEAQLFAVERDEFDEIVNLKIMPDLAGSEGFAYRSTPLSLKDVEQQLKALELLKDALPGSQLIKKTGEVADIDFDLDLDEMNAGERAQRQDTPPSGTNGAKEGQPAPEGGQQPVAKSEERALGLLSLAQQAADALALGVSTPADARVWAEVRRKLDSLAAPEREVVRKLIAVSLMPQFEHDPEGAEELTAWTVDVSARHASR